MQNDEIAVSVQWITWLPCCTKTRINFQ